MIAYAQLVARRPGLVLALVGVISALAAIALPRLSYDDDVVRFLPADDPEVRAFTSITERFGAMEVALIAVEAPPGETLYSQANLVYLRALSRRLGLLSEVAHVTSVSELAIVESMDGGKPIKESRDVDVPLASSHFFYYAGWADKLAYAFAGRAVRPLGVAGQVIPWNFPLLMAAWKLAPALATGNTCVLKPAETTPLTALLLAQIIEE